MTSPMDDALHRTIAAVAQYDVPERFIAIAAHGLEGLPERARRESEVFVLADSIQQAAGMHEGPHPDCLTCVGIKNMLAVAMAAVRAEADIAISRMLRN